MGDRPEDARPVIVTTCHKDVWYGWTSDDVGEEVTLHDARHCYYFDTDEGLGELAASGPPRGSKIGPKVPVCQIRDVVTVQDCTVESAERFANQGWGGER